jgi:hypothetical protein
MRRDGPRGAFGLAQQLREDGRLLHVGRGEVGTAQDMLVHRGPAPQRLGRQYRTGRIDTAGAVDSRQLTVDGDRRGRHDTGDAGRCRSGVECSPVMSRHTTFKFCLDPTVEQHEVLARHAGAARFGFNQCLQMVKTALTQRKSHPDTDMPWSGFDLINTFNAWKKTEDAGRVVAVDTDGVAEVVTTGLPWRREVCQQVFEEAAVDCGRAWLPGRTRAAASAQASESASRDSRGRPA